MKPYVLMLGPKLIPTDAMILEGSQYLLQQAGIQINEYLTINDHTKAQPLPAVRPTHVIILGTPWLWDKCWDSIKYYNLNQLLNVYCPNAKRMFLGIGSCFPIGKADPIKRQLTNTLEKAHNIFKKSLIFTRDMNTAEVLESYKPVPLPCPAFYALYDMLPSDTFSAPAFIWHDPQQGISKIDFSEDSDNLSHYTARFISTYDAYPFSRLYCVDEKEQALALHYLGKTPQIIHSVNQAKILLNNATTVHSGRVHMAIPAYGRAGSVTLQATDSRADALYDVEQGRIMKPNAAITTYVGLFKMFIGS